MPQQPTLFSAKTTPPLAEQLRPKSLADLYGQEHFLGEHSSLVLASRQGQLPSMILWGPPGSGKTSLAHILANQNQYRFMTISAIFSGIAELKKLFDEAEKATLMGIKTLLFVDEIHRFNKTQQDTFLPVLEKGIITLIGATTENPSFALNPALLSRCQVYTLKKLDLAALEHILAKAEAHFGKPLPLTEEARALLKQWADGDARVLLNALALIEPLSPKAPLNGEEVKEILQQPHITFEQTGEDHYNFISVLHKAIRGSDVDGALYWLGRMLHHGEDPYYIIRRLLRATIEDIGLAQSAAISHMNALAQTYERLGSPEGDLALYQMVAYLASAPKSNAVYMAQKHVKAYIEKTGTPPPPLFALNAPTKLMKELNYGKDYSYDHNFEDAFAGQNFFPETTERAVFYQPTHRGDEIEIKKRLQIWEEKRK